MNFILKPTLEHIALVKFVTTLWNNYDIRACLEEFSTSGVLFQEDVSKDVAPFSGIGHYISEKLKKWQTIEVMVIKKVSQYKMTSLKEKMEGYIKPLGMQILQWIEYHRRCLCLDLKLPREFHWTSQGTIDKQKTAKMIISDEHFDIVTRYNLACIYCLEDDIPELLNKVPEDRRVIDLNIADPNGVSKVAILKFWASFVKGNVHWDDIVKITEYSDSDGSHKRALRAASGMANKSAIEYFLPKVQQREKFLLITAARSTFQYFSLFRKLSDPPREYNNEVLWSLLSDMNERQQFRVLKKCGSIIIICLLDWPMQSFFAKTASYLCEILPYGNYSLHSAVKAISCKVSLGFKDYNYRKVFEDLWQHLSDNYKMYIISDSSFSGIVCMLLEIKYRGNIKLMLDYASIAERKNLIFSQAGYIICCDMVRNKELDFLKFFIELCVFSKDEMILLKKKFTDFLSEARFNNQNKIICFLDDLICAFDKRKNETEDSISKRFCRN